VKKGGFLRSGGAGGVIDDEHRADDGGNSFGIVWHLKYVPSCFCKQMPERAVVELPLRINKATK
jgi:hypothetical protein